MTHIRYKEEIKMTKQFKKVYLSLLLIVSALFLALGFMAMGIPMAKADASFAMIDGAQLRISGENNGIRFVAEMDEGTYNSVTGQDGTFGMIIIPESYLTTYANEIATANNDYVKALENVTLLNIENITPYAHEGAYRMNGVMSNVRYDNMNVSFVGIAYYKIGETYTYVTNHDSLASRSVYQVAMSALYDLEKTYTDAEYAYLDSYKYLAECKESNMARPDAVAIKAYTDNLKALRSSFDGTTVNFNSDADLSLVSDGNYYPQYATDRKIVSEEGVSAFQFTATGYCAVKISFPKAIKVYSDSVLTLKVKGQAESDNWLRLNKYKPDTSTSVGFGLDDFNYSSHISTWQTIKINLSDKTTLVQDGYINGLTVLMYGENKTMMIDYISVTSQGGALLNEIEGTNYVATYSSDEYDGLITTSDNYSISNGQLIFNSLTPYAYTTFKFVQPKKVAEGDYVAIKMGATGDIKIKTKTDQKDLLGYSSDVGANYMGQAWFMPTQTKFTFHNYVDHSFTPYESRDWGYLYNSACTIQNIVVPVSYLGYNVNETIDSIQLAAWKADVKIIIEDIAYFSTADFKDGVVADFTKAGSEIFAAGNTYYLGGSSAYSGVLDSDIVYNQEGYVTVTSNSTLGVRFMLKATDVTVDSVIKVNMRWRETGTDVWTRPGYGGTFTGAIDGFNGYVGVGEWMTVEFKLVDLLQSSASCPEFSDGEETMYYLNFFFQVGSLDIKTISIS